jgi:hypothetical protein
MHRYSTKISALFFLTSITLLSGCSKEEKDDVMGQIITDCQLTAHGGMEASPLADEKKHYAIGVFVEKCLKEGGLQPLNIAKDDNLCFEAAPSPEDGNGFIKPLQKCWKNTRSSKN